MGKDVIVMFCALESVWTGFYSCMVFHAEGSLRIKRLGSFPFFRIRIRIRAFLRQLSLKTIARVAGVSAA